MNEVWTVTLQETWVDTADTSSHTRVYSELDGARRGLELWIDALRGLEDLDTEPTDRTDLEEVENDRFFRTDIVIGEESNPILEIVAEIHKQAVRQRGLTA